MKYKPAPFRITPVRTTDPAEAFTVFREDIRPIQPSYVELDVKFATGSPDPLTPCANCGWPLNVVNTSTLFVGTRQNKQYAHYTCPSLSQRRDLRQELKAREQGQ